MSSCQPDRSANRACRRARICCGEPPNCWAGAPPPTHRELTLAKALMLFHIQRRVEASGEEA